MGCTGTSPDTLLPYLYKPRPARRSQSHPPHSAFSAGGRRAPWPASHDLRIRRICDRSLSSHRQILLHSVKPRLLLVTEETDDVALPRPTSFHRSNSPSKPVRHLHCHCVPGKRTPCSSLSHPFSVRNPNPPNPRCPDLDYGHNLEYPSIISERYATPAIHTAPRVHLTIHKRFDWRVADHILQKSTLLFRL